MSVGGNWIPYTVERYDTPWGIAETHLGNGLRWREIKTADGGTLATDDYRWVERDGRPDYEQQALTIYAGQRLWLPPDAPGLPATAAATEPRPPLAPSVLATIIRSAVYAACRCRPPSGPAGSDPRRSRPPSTTQKGLRLPLSTTRNGLGRPPEALAGSSGHHDGIVVELSAAILAAAWLPARRYSPSDGSVNASRVWPVPDSASACPTTHWRKRSWPFGSPGASS